MKVSQLIIDHTSLKFTETIKNRKLIFTPEENRWLKVIENASKAFFGYMWERRNKGNERGLQN